MRWNAMIVRIAEALVAGALGSALVPAAASGTLPAWFAAAIFGTAAGILIELRAARPAVLRVAQLNLCFALPFLLFGFAGGGLAVLAAAVASCLGAAARARMAVQTAAPGDETVLRAAIRGSAAAIAAATYGFVILLPVGALLGPATLGPLAGMVGGIAAMSALLSVERDIRAANACAAPLARGDVSPYALEEPR